MNTGVLAAEFPRAAVELQSLRTDGRYNNGGVDKLRRGAAMDHLPLPARRTLLIVSDRMFEIIVRSQRSRGGFWRECTLDSARLGGNEIFHGPIGKIAGRRNKSPKYDFQLNIFVFLDNINEAV